jgi:hypothetical protein
MSKSTQPPTDDPSFTCCGDWKKKVEDLGGRAQEFARNEPAQAVGLAFLAGLFLTLLPIGRIVSVLIRLAFALIRPALLILGAVKLCEEFDKRNNP